MGIKMETIVGNLLDIEHGLIAHQVNCLGVGGRGLAAQIKSKHPNSFKAYNKLCSEKIKAGNEGSLLGTIQVVPVKENPPLRIVNCFSQLKYGTVGQFTDYDAVESCFSRIKLVNFKKLPLYVPYLYGSTLGGGDWKVVESIISSVYPDAIIVMLPEIASTLDGSH